MVTFRCWLCPALLALLGLALIGAAAEACPFCSAVSLTFTEEINSSDVAVIAKLIKAPEQPKGQGLGATDAGTAEFEILDVLKGAEPLRGKRIFETLYFGDSPVGSTFLVMGTEPPAIKWNSPIVISERGRSYIRHALQLPKEGGDRLVYFQDFLEDADESLTRDAYDEFAKAPYAAVKELKGRLKHDKILEWIKNPKVPASRRRLYLTLLGVHNDPKDAAVLEEMLRSSDREGKAGLDALIAAYLTLRGADGLPLVEELFLKNKQAEYTDTYAAIMALRFHGQEEKAIPRERLLSALRHMLDRPQLADLIIPDLARWEDWSAMDRLVKLFKEADDESSWVRVPVINYLRACPLPAAKAHIEELAKIDPEVVKRASSYFPFGAAIGPAAASRNGGAPKTNEPKKTPQSENDVNIRASKKQPDAANKSSQAAPPVPEAKTKPPSGPDSGSGAAGAKAAVEPDAQAAKVAAARGLMKLAGNRAADRAVGPAAVVGVVAGSAGVLLLAFWAIMYGGQKITA